MRASCSGIKSSSYARHQRSRRTRASPSAYASPLLALEQLSIFFGAAPRQRNRQQTPMAQPKITDAEIAGMDALFGPPPSPPRRRPLGSPNLPPRPEPFAKPPPPRTADKPPVVVENVPSNEAPPLREPARREFSATAADVAD